MIRIELFQPTKHYEIVAQWWKAQDWPAVPLTHLSSTGILVTHNEKPAAAAWIYKTDSAICWMEWIVANPEIRHEARADALSVLISGARMLSQVMGFRSIFMSIKNQSLSGRIEKHGFKATDQGMTNYVCELSRS